MPEYLNPHNHELRLLGPTNQVIKIPSKGKIVLIDWFNKYCPKYLTSVNINQKSQMPTKIITQTRPQKINPPKFKPPISVKSTTQNKHALPKKQTSIAQQAIPQNDKLFSDTSIDAKIGIGILSYNRLNCVKRLLESIYKFTDLSKVSIFVSDESTDQAVINYLNSQPSITVATNQPRLGVAGNSNRLLKMLDQYEYCIILNDDVEVLKRGWEEFYPKASKLTRYHHFCYRQIGVYGANNQEGIITRIKGVKIRTISRKPHGAVMFFTNQLFKKIGYFDKKFPKYGLEHTDWSGRASKTDLVPLGFHDVIDSDRYFRIHNDKSSSPDNKNDLIRARQYYNTVIKNKDRIYLPLEV